MRPSSARLRELEDDGIIAEQRGQLRSVARIDRVSLLGDVTTTWPQNSLVALDCEARIVRARSGFQRIRIAIRLTPTTLAMPCPWEDDEVVRRRRRDAAPHTTEADHVCTKHHNPGAALVH